jgi:hypothetical protein
MKKDSGGALTLTLFSLLCKSFVISPVVVVIEMKLEPNSVSL